MYYIIYNRVIDGKKYNTNQNFHVRRTLWVQIYVPVSYFQVRVLPQLWASVRQPGQESSRWFQDGTVLLPHPGARTARGGEVKK